jgi:hypothetical protein
MVEHDPEKREPVFGKDHAQANDPSLIQFNLIESDSRDIDGRDNGVPAISCGGMRFEAARVSS